MKLINSFTKMMPVALALVTLTAGIEVNAQNKSESTEKKANVHITITENGVTKEINEEIPLNELDELENLIEGLDILKGMDINMDNGDVDVVIKKKKDGSEEIEELEILKDFKFDFNFDMPEEAIEMMGNFHHNGEKRALLGVMGDDWQNGDGAFISKVVENSAADKAGFKQGDVVTAIDGKEVASYNDLVKAITSHKPGEKVVIEYLRAEKKESKKVELGEGAAFATAFKIMGDSSLLKNYHCCQGKKNCNHKNFSFQFDTAMFQNGESFEFDKEGLHERLKELVEKSSVSTNKPFLGIMSDVKEGSGGVLVSSVFEGSTAEELGLQEADVIKSFNGKEVGSIADLKNILNDLEIGDEIQVVYDRNGKEYSKTGELKGKMQSHTKMLQYSFPGSEFDSKEISIKIRIDDLDDSDRKELKDAGIDLAEESDLDVSSIDFSPNPGSGRFNLSFNLPEKGKTTVKVMDMNGKVVYEEKLGNIQGRYQKEIDISNETKGIYFLSITQGKKQFNKKIVKQ